MNAKRAAKAKTSTTKLFVLDTNVLMHDPLSLFRFEEHDIFVPMMTLEELDANKKGMSEVARNARQSSRLLDEIVSGAEHNIAQGIDLTGPSRELATGHLFLQTEAINGVLPISLPTAKADNQIIAVVMHLAQHHPKRNVDRWCRRTSTCGSRRARWGWPRRITSTTRCSRTPELLFSGTRELPGGLLGPARQGHGVVAAGRPHVLPADGPAYASRCCRTNSCTRRSRTRRHFYAIVKRGAGQDGAPVDAQGLHAPEEQRLGHHGAQPRAELRPQPADESRDRLRHAARARRAPARRC
jgi:hypothetical protein